MSTRSSITVRDESGAFSLYRHSDGYPDTKHGVIATLAQALPLAWPAPRFEADDFAAAIVAAWKHAGGNIRLSEGHESHADTAFHYEIYQRTDGAVMVQIFVPTETQFDRVWRKFGTPKRLTKGK